MITFKPRLQAARKELGLKAPNLGDVVQAYKDWVSFPEYLIFQSIDYTSGYFTDPLPRVPSIWISYEVKYKAALASKRGNTIYRVRLEDRLKILDEGREYSISFFARGKARKFTSWVFVTLTYGREDPLGVVWDNVGVDFNRWLTGIRKRFGRCEVVRTWEAHEDGYPHIHCLLMFHDEEFTVFRYKNKWRLHKKKLFEWSWGWVDVQAIKEPAKAFRYITKYIRKAINVAGSKAILTMALTWFYRRRSWSCSKSINDLIRALRNSNDITSDRGVWKLLGFWGDGSRLPRYHLHSLEYYFEDQETLPGAISVEVFRLLYGSEGWSDFKYRRRTSPMEVGE